LYLDEEAERKQLLRTTGSLTLCQEEKGNREGKGNCSLWKEEKKIPCSKGLQDLLGEGGKRDIRSRIQGNQSFQSLAGKRGGGRAGVSFHPLFGGKKGEER